LNLVELCRQAIAIDSTPSNGNREVAEYFVQLAETMGFEVTPVEEIYNGIEQLNIVLRSPQKPSGGEILLLTHLDTPDPGSYALWDQNLGNPFNACIYQDTLYGIGSADGKLDFLCKLLAAQKYLERPLKKLFAIVGTFGSQFGLVGAVKLIRKKSVNAKVALVGEPTQGQLTRAGSGLTLVEVAFPFSQEERDYHQKHNTMESSSSQSKMFRGKAVLSSHPTLGDNAIINMFEYLLNLPDGIAIMEMEGGISANSVPSTAVLEIDLVGGLKNTVAQKILKVMETLKEIEAEFQDFAASGFDPEVSTLNIGQVRTQRDHIKVLGSCRILPSVSNEVMEAWMSRLKSTCEEVGATFQIVTNKRPFETSADETIVKSCQEILKEMGRSPKLVKSTACTEANVLSRFGISTLVWGPGQGVGNTHQPNEHIKISELEFAIDFYSRFIEKTCL